LDRPRLGWGGLNWAGRFEQRFVSGVRVFRVDKVPCRFVTHLSSQLLSAPDHHTCCARQDAVGLHELTQDLATMVTEQGEALNVLETNVESTRKNVQDGIGHLEVVRGVCLAATNMVDPNDISHGKGGSLTPMGIHGGCRVQANDRQKAYRKKLWIVLCCGILIVVAILVPTLIKFVK